MRPRAFEAGAPVAVLGLGVSGEAAARLAHAGGAVVYASDISDGESQRNAAGRLRELGVQAETGGHEVERILRCDLVIASPGISPHSDIRRRIAAAGVRTIAEVELAYRDLRSRVIGVTGTNGKTTTTGLAAHVLSSAGIRVAAVGNIGRPLSETALSEDQPEWVVVELSSFQLADLELFRPEIGVLLNLAPDHLDRYRDVESYYRDKRELFSRAESDSRWILNADDPAVLDLADGAPGERYLFSRSGPLERGAWLDDDGWLVGEIEPPAVRWERADALRLLGSHNIENALAAGLAAGLAGCPSDRIGLGLASFPPLPHRLEPLGERAGVLWVNDSKGTNVTATSAALRAFDRPVVLLLGGRHKGESYAQLLPEIRDRVRAVVAFGEAAPLILAELDAHVAALHVESGMEAAVRTAAEVARSGDVVLLSPACSSFDMFPDYRARGAAFAAALRRLDGAEGSAA